MIAEVSIEADAELAEVIGLLESVGALLNAAESREGDGGEDGDDGDDDEELDESEGAISDVHGENGGFKTYMVTEGNHALVWEKSIRRAE